MPRHEKPGGNICRQSGRADEVGCDATVPISMPFDPGSIKRPVWIRRMHPTTGNLRKADPTNKCLDIASRRSDIAARLTLQLGNVPCSPLFALRASLISYLIYETYLERSS
jgi:hypothetical protein